MAWHRAETPITDVIYRNPNNWLSSRKWNFRGSYDLKPPLFAGRNQISWNDGFQPWVWEQIIALLKEVWLQNVRHDIKYVRERTAMYVLPNKRKREKATRFPISLVYEILPKTSSHTVLPIFFYKFQHSMTRRKTGPTAVRSRRIFMRSRNHKLSSFWLAYLVCTYACLETAFRLELTTFFCIMGILQTHSVVFLWRTL